jgi:hypothetical protein
MSTPNGQHPLETNGGTSHATSTVLALDGWGPVIAEPAANGSNGNEPEIVVEAPHAPSSEAPRDDRFASVRRNLRFDISHPSIDSSLIRVIAPVAAMTIAVLAALKLGDTYLNSIESAPPPSPPSRVAVLRRSIALSVDPSLTPPQPERPIWQRWLG